VHIAMQSSTLGRLVTFNPLEPGTESSATGTVPEDERDFGCVDWYLYPVNRKLPVPESSRSALRGGAAAPAGENRPA